MAETLGPKKRLEKLQSSVDKLKLRLRAPGCAEIPDKILEKMVECGLEPPAVLTVVGSGASEHVTHRLAAVFKADAQALPEMLKEVGLSYDDYDEETNPTGLFLAESTSRTRTKPSVAKVALTWLWGAPNNLFSDSVSDITKKLSPAYVAAVERMDKKRDADIIAIARQMPQCAQAIAVIEQDRPGMLEKLFTQGNAPRFFNTDASVSKRKHNFYECILIYAAAQDSRLRVKLDEIKVKFYPSYMATVFSTPIWSEKALDVLSEADDEMCVIVQNARALREKRKKDKTKTAG